MTNPFFVFVGCQIGLGYLHELLRELVGICSFAKPNVGRVIGCAPVVGFSFHISRLAVAHKKLKLER